MPDIIRTRLIEIRTPVCGAYDLTHEAVQLLLGASQFFSVRFVLTIPHRHPFCSPIVIDNASLITTRQRSQQVDHQGGIGVWSLYGKDGRDVSSSAKDEREMEECSLSVRSTNRLDFFEEALDGLGMIRDSRR